MKQKTIFFCFATLVHSIVFCQSIEWHNTSHHQTTHYTGEFIQTVGNNVFTAGNFVAGINFISSSLTTTNNSSSFYLANYDTLGTLKWVLKGGKDNLNDFLNDMKVDKYGNAYVLGEFTDTFSIGNFTLIPDCAPTSPLIQKEGFLLKISPAGVVLWGRVFHGSTCRNLGMSKPFLLSIADSSIYAAGIFSKSVSVSHSNLTLTKNASRAGEYYISRFDLNGNLNLLQKMVSNNVNVPNSILTDLEAKNDSVYYATGFFYTNQFFGSNNQSFTSSSQQGKCLILSYTNANCTWLLKPEGYGNINAGLNNCLLETTEHNVYLAGTYNYNVVFQNDTLLSNSQTGLHTAWFLAKLNNSGTFQKTKSIDIGGFQLRDFSISALSELTLSGNFDDSLIYLDSNKVFSKSNNDLLIYHLDSSFNYSWHLNEPNIYSFEIASSNPYSNYVFGGYENSTSLGRDTINGLTINNNLLFKVTDCNIYSSNYSIGNNVILGGKTPNFTFDAGSTNRTFLWSDSSTNQTLTVHYDAAKAGTVDTIYVQAITSGNCLVRDTVLVQHDLSTLTKESELFSDFLNVYPNPFSETIHLSNGNNNADHFQLEIYSSTGQLIYSEREIERDNLTNYVIHTASFAKGVYFLKISSTLGNTFKKLVKN